MKKIQKAWILTSLGYGFLIGGIIADFTDYFFTTIIALLLFLVSFVIQKKK